MGIAAGSRSHKKGVWLPVGAVFIVWERYFVGAASSRETETLLRD